MSARKQKASERPLWAGWRHLFQPIDAWQEIGAVDEAYEATLLDGDDRGALAVWQRLRQAYGSLLEARRAQTISWKVRDARALMLEVRSAAPTHRTVELQRRVAEILQAGNERQRWRIPIPDIPAPLPPAPRSPFQHTSFAGMVAYQPLFDQFVSSLSYPVDFADARAYWGRLFASALFFGALMRPRWLWALPDAIPSVSDPCRWLELYDRPSEGSRPAHFRWYLDPVTRYLIVSDPPTPSLRAFSPVHRTGGNIYSWIRIYYRAAGIDESLLPGNWSRLLEVVHTRLALYVPAYLLRHAAGRNAATPVPPSVHERLIEPPRTIHIDPPHICGPTAEEETGRARQHEGQSREDTSEWPADLRALVSVIRAQDPVDAEAVRDWLRRRRASHAPPLLASVARVAEWVAEWLSQPHGKRRKARKRTVYERYNAVAERLVGQLATTDPVELGSDADFSELYQDALEDGTTLAKRRRIANGLRSFHAFLVNYHSVAVEAPEVLRVPGARRGPPDANYISGQAFEAAVQWLQRRQRLSSTESRQACLMASLGYYAGLRRGEVLGLALDDLDGSPDYELLVRPQQHRLLKSGNTARILPLGVLLPPQRLAELVEWQREQRAALEAMGRRAEQALLLSRAPGAQNVPGERLLGEFIQALTQVSGDTRLRYHHLRHSFASGLIVCLWEAEAGDRAHGAPVPWVQPQVTGWDARVRERLLGSGPVQRRALYLVARAMGHADTATTVEHYVHSLDDLLQRAVRRISDGLSNSELAQLTGRSESRVRAVRQQIGDGSTSAALDELTDQRLPAAVRRAQPGSAHHDEPARGEAPLRIALPREFLNRWLLLSEAVDAVDADGGEPSSGVVYPWPGEQLSRACDAARRLPAGMRRRATRASEAGPLVHLPRTKAEWALARATLIALYGDDEKAATFSLHHRKALLRSYHQGWQPGRLVTVRFDAVADFKRWRRLIHVIGIDAGYAFYHVPAAHSQAGSPSKQLTYWQRIHSEIEAADPVRFPPDRHSGMLGYVVACPKWSPRDGQRMQMFGLVWSLAIAITWEWS